MNVYHYTAAHTLADAGRHSPESQKGSRYLLFTPEIAWAPTSFTKDSRGGVRVVTREEMQLAGMRRFGVAAGELTLLSQLPSEHLHALDPLLDALAAVGVEPVGWRVMTDRRSTADLIHDIFQEGRWHRVVGARWGGGKLQVIRRVQMLSGGCPASSGTYP